MNILYLHQHFALRSGSGGVRSFEFSRMFVEGGHRVTLLCGRDARSGLSRPGTGLTTEEEHDGVRIVQLNVPYRQEMGFLRRLWAFIWFMLMSAWVASRQKNIDVIFATSTPLTIAVPGMIASLILGKPFVFEVRDLWPEIPIGLGVLRNPILIALAKMLEKLAYRRAQHIVALSPGMKEGVVNRGIPENKVTVVPNGSGVDFFNVSPMKGQAFRQKHGIPLDKPLVVYTGAFGPVNEVSYLVQVAHHMAERGDGVYFLLIGTGKLFEPTRQLAKELGLLDKWVWVLAAVPRYEIPAVLSAATLATSTVTDNPVLWNNSANKFFDALAAGRPIAINHRGWQADLLEETGAGLVLPATDWAVAADILSAKLSDEVWLAEAQRAARQLVETRFDMVKLSKRVEMILQNAVGE